MLPKNKHFNSSSLALELPSFDLLDFLHDRVNHVVIVGQQDNIAAGELEKFVRSMQDNIRVVNQFQQDIHHVFNPGLGHLQTEFELRREYKNKQQAFDELDVLAKQYQSENNKIQYENIKIEQLRKSNEIKRLQIDIKKLSAVTKGLLGRKNNIEKYLNEFHWDEEKRNQLEIIKNEWEKHALFATMNSAQLQVFYRDLLQAKAAFIDIQKAFYKTFYNDTQRTAANKTITENAVYNDAIRYLKEYGKCLAAMEKQVIESMLARLQAAETYKDLACDDVMANTYDQLQVLGQRNIDTIHWVKDPRQGENRENIFLNIGDEEHKQYRLVLLTTGLSAATASYFYRSVLEYANTAKEALSSARPKQRTKKDTHLRQLGHAVAVMSKMTDSPLFKKPEELKIIEDKIIKTATKSANDNEPQHLQKNNKEWMLSASAEIWFAINTLLNTPTSPLLPATNLLFFTDDVNEQGELTWFENNKLLLDKAENAYRAIQENQQYAIHQQSHYEKLKQHIEKEFARLNEYYVAKQNTIRQEAYLAAQNEINKLFDQFEEHCISDQTIAQIKSSLQRLQKLINRYSNRDLNSYIEELDPLRLLLNRMKKQISESAFFNGTQIINIQKILSHFTLHEQVAPLNPEKLYQVIQEWSQLGAARETVNTIYGMITPRTKLQENELIEVIARIPKPQPAENAWFTLKDIHMGDDKKKKVVNAKIPTVLNTPANQKNLTSSTWRAGFINSKQELFQAIEKLETNIGMYTHDLMSAALDADNQDNMLSTVTNVPLLLSSVDYMQRELDKAIGEEEKTFKIRFHMGDGWLNRKLHKKSYEMQSVWIEQLKEEKKKVEKYEKQIIDQVIKQGIKDKDGRLDFRQIDYVRLFITDRIHDPVRLNKFLIQLYNTCIHAVANKCAEYFSKSPEQAVDSVDLDYIKSAIDYFKQYDCYKQFRQYMLSSAYHVGDDYIDRYDGDNNFYADLITILYRETAGDTGLAVVYGQIRFDKQLTRNGWNSLDNGDWEYLQNNRDNPEVIKSFRLIANALVGFSQGDQDAIQQSWNPTAAKFIEEFGADDQIDGYRAKGIIQLLEMPAAERYVLDTYQAAVLVTNMQYVSLSYNRVPYIQKESLAEKNIMTALDTRLIEIKQNQTSWSALDEEIFLSFGHVDQIQELHYRCAIAVLKGHEQGQAELWLRDQLEKIGEDPKKLIEFFGIDNLSKLLKEEMVQFNQEYLTQTIQPITNAKDAVAPEAIDAFIQTTSTFSILYNLFHNEQLLEAIGAEEELAQLRAKQEKQTALLKSQHDLNAFAKSFCEVLQSEPKANKILTSLSQTNRALSLSKERKHDFQFQADKLKAQPTVLSAKETKAMWEELYVKQATLLAEKAGKEVTEIEKLKQRWLNPEIDLNEDDEYKKLADTNKNLEQARAAYLVVSTAKKYDYQYEDKPTLFYTHYLNPIMDFCKSFPDNFNNLTNAQVMVQINKLKEMISNSVFDGVFDFTFYSQDLVNPWITQLESTISQVEFIQQPNFSNEIYPLVKALKDKLVSPADNIQQHARDINNLLNKLEKIILNTKQTVSFQVSGLKAIAALREFAAFGAKADETGVYIDKILLQRFLQAMNETLTELRLTNHFALADWMGWLASRAEILQSHLQQLPAAQQQDALQAVRASIEPMLSVYQKIMVHPEANKIELFIRTFANEVQREYITCYRLANDMVRYNKFDAKEEFFAQIKTNVKKFEAAYYDGDLIYQAMMKILHQQKNVKSDDIAEVERMIEQFSAFLLNVTAAPTIENYIKSLNDEDALLLWKQYISILRHFHLAKPEEAPALHLYKRLVNLLTTRLLSAEQAVITQFEHDLGKEFAGLQNGSGKSIYAAAAKPGYYIESLQQTANQVHANAIIKQIENNLINTHPIEGPIMFGLLTALVKNSGINFAKLNEIEGGGQSSANKIFRETLAKILSDAKGKIELSIELSEQNIMKLYGFTLIYQQAQLVLGSGETNDLEKLHTLTKAQRAEYDKRENKKEKMPDYIEVIQDIDVRLNHAARKREEYEKRKEYKAK